MNLSKSREVSQATSQMLQTRIQQIQKKMRSIQTRTEQRQKRKAREKSSDTMKISTKFWQKRGGRGKIAKKIAKSNKKTSLLKGNSQKLAKFVRFFVNLV